MDYIKKDKRKKIKNNIGKFFIFFLIILCIILSYILYEKTQISQNNNENNINPIIEINRIILKTANFFIITFLVLHF